MVPLPTSGCKFAPMRTLLLTLALCLPCTCALAQPAPPDVPAPVGSVVAQAHRELATDATLDDTRREALSALLERAAADDAEAETELARARALHAEATALEERIEALEAELRNEPSERFARWRDSLDASVGAAVLARQAADLEAAAGNLSARISDTSAQLAAVDQRPNALAQALDQARREADAATARITPPQGATAAQRIDALAAQATRRLQLARAQALSAERSTLPARTRMLELTQRSLQRQASLVRRQAGVVASLLALSTDAELNALDSRLRDEADGAGGQSPRLASEAERNVALGQELASVEATTRQANEKLRQTRSRSDETIDALRNTRARLALQSHDDAVGLILLNERRRADEPLRIRAELAQARRQLAQAQLRLIDLDAQADALDLPQTAAALLREGDEESDTPDLHAEAGLRALLATRAELVERLVSAERELLRALTELEATLDQHLDTTTALVQLLDRELLWFPSHERAGPAWFKRQLAGWRDLFKPSRYATSARLLGGVLKDSWPLLAAAGVLLILLLRQRRRLPQRLHALAQPLLRVRTDRYRHTLAALAETGLAAFAVPLPIALCGWLLRQAGEAGKFSDSLGKALLTTAGALFFWQALRWLVADAGVAQKHFRWTQARREAIATALPWFAGLILPAQFLLALAFMRGQEPALDAVGRLSLLAICGVGALMGWRLLAPGRLWTFRGTADAEPSQARRALRVGLCAGLLAIAALALNGYVLTAATLLHSLWLSLLLITTLAIFHGMVSRWFLLGERRLALRRIEARREAEDDQAALPTHTNAAGEPAQVDPENEALSIQSISQQTHRLLRALIIALLALGLLWVWSGVLPALDRLDTITLWTVTGTDAGGAPAPLPVTLAALLAGLLTLALTFICARNLPGLVELGLLSRIHIDAGTRYAITSVSRYLIVIIGTIAGMSLLGVRWGQLQWLAAALTVGLGFGLQEIFANFVSGLIVLFERPYRVGDTITIGEVEGRVTRIRTRATTVLDSDNREVVVPNKTFITSRFVNWTLSDTVTRLVFKLGIAQDADPQKVRELLLELARSEPLVLAQPAPGCWFTQISSGTFDFELRVFVAELGHRTLLRDALNRRIAAAMARAGLATSRPGLLQIRMDPAQAQDDGENVGA